MQSKAPYKLLLHSKAVFNDSTKKQSRSPEQIDLLTELMINNEVFSHLEICDRMVLIWADHPHVNEIAENEVYFLLEGKAFEYMQNCNSALTASVYGDADYMMVRKLVANDFFVVYSPSGKYADQNNYKKYQLMVDQNTLIGKISGETFRNYFAQFVEERWRKTMTFLKKVKMLQTLPQLMFYELSKYMKEKSFNEGAQIIGRQEKCQYIYFIQAGEVELKVYTDEEQHKKSPSKNYKISHAKLFNKTSLKQNDVFGIDSFNATTFEDQNIEYSAEAKTNCLCFRIDKRIFAIVVSSFEEAFKRKSKILSSINLNDQIQGQGYQTTEMIVLSRNAHKIKTSQRKIRDIKLRHFNTAQKSRLRKDPIADMKDEEVTETLADIKYKSCQNFAQIKVTKDRSTKKFYETFNINMNSLSGLFHEEKPRLNHIVLSAVDDEGELSEPVCYSDKTVMAKTGSFTGQLRSYQHLKRRSEMHSSGKQQTDIIKSYLQKKLKSEMLKKAELILERNKTRRIKDRLHVKRVFSLQNGKQKKNIEKSSPLKNKRIDDELYDRMNRLSQNPLLSLMEGSRKQLQKQAAKIIQNKLKLEKSRASLVNSANAPIKSKGLIMIRNNE